MSLKMENTRKRIVVWSIFWPISTFHRLKFEQKEMIDRKSKNLNRNSSFLLEDFHKMNVHQGVLTHRQEKLNVRCSSIDKNLRHSKSKHRKTKEHFSSAQIFVFYFVFSTIFISFDKIKTSLSNTHRITSTISFDKFLFDFIFNVPKTNFCSFSTITSMKMTEKNRSIFFIDERSNCFNDPKSIVATT